MGETLTVGVTGLNAGESPQPGPAVARCLRRVRGWKGRIVGLLYDAMESGVYLDDLVDDAYLIPYPSSGLESLKARIEAIHSRQKFDVIIPTLDAELPAFIRLAPRLRELGIATFLPDEIQLEARSKARLEEMARQLRIDAPRQILVASPEQIPSAFAALGGQAVVKGVYYEAGRAATVADAHKIAEKIAARWGYPLIMQQPIRGEEYDLCCLGDGKGKMIGAVGMKKMSLTEKGKAFGGMTVNDETLFAIGRTFIAATKWRGPLEMEFVKAADNSRYYLIEINPRFPAWVYLTAAVGQNLPWAVVRLARGETLRAFRPHPAGVFFVRHASDIVSDISRLEQLTVNGEVHR